MTEYRKVPERNKKGRKLYGPTHDKQTKYRGSGLWIKNRKRTYLYWYKFLQYCIRYHYQDIKLDRYRGWDIHHLIESKLNLSECLILFV